MAARRLLNELLSPISPPFAAPLAPSAPLALGTPSANATGTPVALSAADMGAKNSQDQQIALLALVVVLAIFAFLGAFIYMMIQKSPTPERTQEPAQEGPAIGGSVRGLQNFLFSRSAGANVGLDPKLIKCLPQEIYTSQEGSLRRRMPLGLPSPGGVALGIPIVPSAVPLTPRGPTPAGTAPELTSLVVSPTGDRPAAGSQEALPAGSEPVPVAADSADAKTSAVGPTESNRKSGCYMRECPVCLGEYKEGDLIKWLPDCQHPFHGACIDAWLRSHSTCPLCRVPVGPALVRLARPAA